FTGQQSWPTTATIQDGSIRGASHGRILEPPPDRGCVRRTSRSKCGCAKSLNDPKTRGLAVSLRLVLRTQPRSVSARFWWWYQDAPGRAVPSPNSLTFMIPPLGVRRPPDFGFRASFELGHSSFGFPAARAPQPCEA